MTALRHQPEQNQRTTPAATLVSEIAAGTPCALASSLETYDNSTGVTHVYLEGGEVAGGYGPGR